MANKITINKEDFEVPENESLQVLAEKTNSDLTFGCFSGRCGACKIEVLSNMNNLNPRNDLEDFYFEQSDDPTSYRLACQCIPTGDFNARITD